MVRRYRFLAWLSIGLLASWVMVPKAASATATILDLDRWGPISGSIATPNAACLIGELRGPATGGSGDGFPWHVYTLLRPSSCTACPTSGGLELRSVTIHAQLSSVGCSLPITISIVEAAGSPGCLVPDPSRVVCPEVSATLTGVAGFCPAYTVPLPPGCCITRDVFVRVTIVGFGTCPTPGPYLICTTEPCIPCQSYYQGGCVDCPITENCNNWMISADADCCAPTPTLPQSWGRMKTLYR